MSKRDALLLIDDMLQSAIKIKKYTRGFNFEDFRTDEKTIDAVVRNFEIIGEAANRIPDEFKNTNSGIQWNRIRGFRNRIVHEYFGIDVEIIWTIMEKYLDELIESLEKIIEKNKH